MAATKTKSANPKTAKPRERHEEHGLKGSMNRAEVFYQKNSKTINIVCIIIILLIGGYFGYKNLYIKPREKKAVAMEFKAQQYFERDSFRLALEGDGNNYGFLQVIDRYGATKAGETARYSAGVCYIRLGQYQKGIDYLKQFDADDQVVQAMAYGLMGDAYMELGNTKEGINWYQKAAAYKDNEVISPLYLFRAGLACEKAGRTKDAIEIFSRIKNKYPLSPEGRDMDKYLAQLGVTTD
jgi:tetratricopeptide (TPR) repeat protein